MRKNLKTMKVKSVIRAYFEAKNKEFFFKDINKLIKKSKNY